MSQGIDTPVTVSPKRRLWRRWITLVALLLAALGGAGWYWLGGSAPPAVSYAGVDATVVEAIEEARSRVRWRPRSGAAWGRLGQIFRAHAYMPEASFCFAQAERFDPQNPRWPYLIGSPMLALGDPDQAMPHLRRAAALSERFDRVNPTPALRLAEVLFKRGDLDEAQTLLQRLEESFPSNPRVQFNLGLLALARDDLQTAAAYFKKCGRDSQARRKAAAQLALIYHRLGDEKLASAFNARSVAKPDDLDWADPYLAECLRLEAGRAHYLQIAEEMQGGGQTADAVQLLENLTQQFPDADSFTELASSLIKKGDHERAEDVARAALRLNPDRVQAHFYLGVALLIQGEQLMSGMREQALTKFAESEQSSRRATELMPDHAWAHLNRARALRYLARRDEAIAAIRQALGYMPELVDAYLDLSHLLAEAGMKDEAEACLKSAELVNPRDPRVETARRRLRSESRNP